MSFSSRPTPIRKAQSELPKYLTFLPEQEQNFSISSASQRYKNQYTRIVTWFERGVNFLPVSIASQIRSILERFYDVPYFAS